MNSHTQHSAPCKEHPLQTAAQRSRERKQQRKEATALPGPAPLDDKRNAALKVLDIKSRFGSVEGYRKELVDDLFEKLRHPSTFPFSGEQKNDFIKEVWLQVNEIKRAEALFEVVTEEEIVECEIENVRHRLSWYDIKNLEWEWLKEGEPYLLKITGYRGDRDAWEEVLGPKVSFPIAVDLEWERLCHEKKAKFPDLSWPSSGAAKVFFAELFNYLEKRGYSKGVVDGFYEELQKRPWIHHSDDLVLTDTRKAPVPQAEEGGESEGESDPALRDKRVPTNEN